MSTTTPTTADAPSADLQAVHAFYATLLTRPAGLTKAQLYAVLSEDYVSVPTPPMGPGAEGMFATLQYFAEVVPDLTWEPREIIPHGNRYTVRGTATGTPVGPFFGVDPATGKRFEIMSIDILTVEDGRVVHAYHLEDWTGAIAQLTAA
ncbi:MAG: ester cyclase [Bacteroidota bacterium]